MRIGDLKQSECQALDPLSKVRSMDSTDIFSNSSSTQGAPDVVHDLVGRPYHVTGIVGYGGQGTAYLEASGDYIVKIVNVRDPAKRHELMRRYKFLLAQRQVVEDGARLVLPEAILAAPYTGYVMRRVKGHQPLTSLIMPPVAGDLSFDDWYNRETGGLRRRLLLAGLISRCFYHLHGSNLSYCDLSDKNLLVAKDPSVASVCLIDPDNLSAPAAAEALVLGTPLYMAPELLNDSRQPDILTDSYSLAVLLFQILRLGHPMIGDSVLDGPPELEEKALRGELPFVDHPEDASNRRTRLLPAEETCTSTLAALFQRAFVDGVHSRSHRPSPGAWEEAALIAAGNTLVCERCLASFFPHKNEQNPSLCKCPWCQNLVPFPPVVSFFDAARDGGRSVTRKISTLVVPTSGSCAVSARYALRGAIAEEGDEAVVLLHDVDLAGRAVLRNQSTTSVFMWRPGGGTITILVPGSSAPLEPDLVACFSDPRTAGNAAVRCMRLQVPQPAVTVTER